MVTTARHTIRPPDRLIQDPAPTGLRQPSRIRLKRFSLEERLIPVRIGPLLKGDRLGLQDHLRRLIVR